MIRRVINIDEDKCNGCGICVNACHEGAIGLVDGKAKLMRDDYCDGLGDCLPTCPTGAITFVEREAVPYNEAAVMENKKRNQQANNNDGNNNNNNNGGNNNIGSSNSNNNGGNNNTVSSNNNIDNSGHAAAHVHSGCPGSMMRSLRNRNINDSVSENDGITGNQAMPCAIQSRLENWPVQIKLAPVNAPYFKNAKLLIAADCAAYAYAGFHDKFIKDKITLIGCPKLDSTDYSDKLSEILRYNDIKSITVVRMEVPCCGGLAHAAMEALRKSEKMIPWNVVTISLDGRIIDE